MIRTVQVESLTHIQSQDTCLMGSPRLAPSLAPLSSEAEDAFTMDNNFGALVRQLRDILGPDKGLTSDDIDIDTIKKLMESYQSDESEWGKFALHDPTKNYSRNGVVNLNGNANLLILVWEPSKGSAIHDHANAHCCMKILKGELTESLFKIPEGEGLQMVPTKKTVLHTNEVGYISDLIGLHSISNSDPKNVAVSLHLYTPPYAFMYGCSSYEASNGHKNHVDMSKNFSWNGHILHELDSSEC